MPLTLLAGLARLRIALMIAGLCWFVDLDAPLATRILIAALALAALVLDGLIDEQKLSRHYVRTKGPGDYRPAA